MNILERKTQPPLCPFCGQEIAPPHPFDDFLYEFDGGECSCGAVYGLDPTSRNGGMVMMQAMVQACKGDWEKAHSSWPRSRLPGWYYSKIQLFDPPGKRPRCLRHHLLHPP